MARNRIVASGVWPSGTVMLAGAAAALAAAAVGNSWYARRVERRHPPRGRLVTVDGARLHYLERGEGSPVVLIHGNVVTAEDYALSGVLDLLAERHRVIAFDRPGFGYSDRPHGRLWTPAAQAAQLARALTRLGVKRATVVGHSWGTLVAIALALAEPSRVGGLVLLSGYYHPTFRADALLAAPTAIPVIGDVLRYTVSPPFTAAMLPLTVKGMFAPLPVPERFAAGFDGGMAARPWQIRAESQDGALMIPSAAALRSRYQELSMPVAIMAGEKDQVADVGRQSIRLHEELAESELQLVPGAGHMVHHAVPERVAAMVAGVAARVSP